MPCPFRSISFGVALLALAIVCSSAGAIEPLVSSPINVTQAELEIRGVLAEKVTLEFHETPLTAVLDYLHDKYHLQIQIDTPALTTTDAQGKTSKIDLAKLLITINLKNISLRSALNLILNPHDLAWTIKDEVLMITTREAVNSMMQTRLYDVRDLVVNEMDRGAEPDFDALVDTLQTTVNPQSWDKTGGQGSISGFANNGIVGLAVWQNYDGQEQVETLLVKLRALRPQKAVRQ